MLSTAAHRRDPLRAGPPDTSLLRAFIAIDLTATVRRRLTEIASGLAATTPSGAVRWVNPQGIHLTLKFLGEVSEERGPDIARQVEVIANGQAQFEVSIRGTGCFPSLRAPRVVWIGATAVDDSLERLQASLEAACEKLGFAREGRAFSPHLTLGRVNRGARQRDIEALRAGLEQLGGAEAGSMRVDRLHLFRSDLKPTGAVYTILATARLRGGEE